MVSFDPNTLHDNKSLGIYYNMKIKNFVYIEFVL